MEKNSYKGLIRYNSFALSIIKACNEQGNHELRDAVLKILNRRLNKKD